MISLLNYKETVVTLEKPAFAQSCDALFVQVIFLLHELHKAHNKIIKHYDYLALCSNFIQCHSSSNLIVYSDYNAFMSLCST